MLTHCTVGTNVNALQLLYTMTTHFWTTSWKHTGEWMILAMSECVIAHFCNFCHILPGNMHRTIGSYYYQVLYIVWGIYNCRYSILACCQLFWWTCSQPDSHYQALLWWCSIQLCYKLPLSALLIPFLSLEMFQTLPSRFLWYNHSSLSGTVTVCSTSTVYIALAVLKYRRVIC